MSQSAHRLTELDALRGMAALSVAFFHYSWQYHRSYHPLSEPTFLFQYGYLGVHLFFIISGFVIFMTIEKTKKPLDFIVSRFSRIYPAYLLVLLINRFIFKESGFRELAFHLTMLEKWFGVNYTDGSFWTLTTELTFYAVILVVFMVRGLKYIEYIGLAWLGIMAVYHFNLTHFHFDGQTEKALLLQHGNLFFAGIVFYKIKMEGQSMFKNSCIAACLLAQFLVFPNQVVWDMTIAGFFVIFYLFCFGKLTFLNNPILVYTGTISYSFYLIHQNLGFKALMFFDSLRINYNMALFLTLASSVAVASLITFLVERPALYKIRNRYKDLNSRI